jgi:RNA polymerase sigma factor (sigma-70 family)
VVEVQEIGGKKGKSSAHQPSRRQLWVNVRPEAAMGAGMTMQPLRRPLAWIQITELGQTDGPTDGELLTRYIEEQDEAAIATLVRRLAPMVLGVCRRVIGDAHLAEDACQATFLVLVRRASEIRPELVGGWVYGVAYRIARRAKAARTRQCIKEQSISGHSVPATDPSNQLDDLLPVLDEELARLPSHYQAVIILCDLEGRTRKEAANRLDIPDGTLSSRLAAARRMLARRLSRRGVTLSLASLVSASGAARVSAALADSIVRVATGKSPDEARAVALAYGELKMMFLTKLKALTVAVFVTVLGFDFAAGARQTTAAGDRLFFVTANSSNKPTDPPAPTVIDSDGPVYAVAFSPDGKLIAVQACIDSGKGDDSERYKEHTVKVWDVKTGKLVKTFLEDGRSSGIAFAPDGKSIAAVVSKTGAMAALKDDNNEVRIWSLTDQIETNLLGSKAAWLYEVAYSPDGKYVAAGGVLFDETGEANGGEVIVWDMTTGNVLWQNKDHKNAVRRLTFSADGKRLVTPSDDNTVRVWDAFTGKHLRTIETQDEKWYSAAFSPDGKLIVAGGSDGVKVWDGENGELMQFFKGYEMGTNIVIAQFLANGVLIAGGTSEKRDGNLKFWDVKTGKLLRGIAEPNMTFHAMDVSRDGKMVAVGTWEKRLVIVSIDK